MNNLESFYAKNVTDNFLYRVAKHSCMPSAAVKEWEVDGVPCLIVVATRALAENEEIYLDLGYQLEVCMIL